MVCLHLPLLRQYVPCVYYFALDRSSQSECVGKSEAIPVTRQVGVDSSEIDESQYHRVRSRTARQQLSYYAQYLHLPALLFEHSVANTTALSRSSVNIHMLQAHPDSLFTKGLSK
jgi:hypothetical protein